MKHFLYCCTMEEIWKDIEGYEGLYQVSNLGRVKSMGNGNSNRSKEIIMKQTKNMKGYPMIILCKEGVCKGFSVHRLVATAFLPNPDNLPQINHKDEDKTNNMVWVNEDGSIDYNKSNLEFCTPKYNVNYGTRTEKVVKALSIPVLQFTKSGEFIRKWDSIIQVERELGISNSNISMCCKGKRKSAYSYKWQYVDDYLADWWEKEMDKN